MRSSLLQLENLQNTGSFKYRGATNAIERLHEDGRQPVIVAASAGNHALGVAVASKHRGFEYHIFMPESTPLTKTAAVRRYTGDVVLAGIDFDDCERQSREYAEKRDAVFVHPFDDPDVVAGQGTIGVELVNDWKEIADENRNLDSPDYLIIPCGGGGLLAGIGTVIAKEWPKTTIIAVEPERVPSLSAAFEQGSPSRVSGDSTIAEGAAVRLIGKNTLACVQKFLHPDHIWAVTENNIAVAILSLMEDARVLAEGAAAIPLAAMIQKESEARGFFRAKTVICLVSGGNFDISSLSAVVSRGLVLQSRRTKFRFRVRDRPGALADITKALSEAGVNIVELDHTRYSDDIDLDEAEVIAVVETQDARHADEVFQSLSTDSRFKVSRPGR